MKSPADARDDVARRLRKTWSQVVAGQTWAQEFPLGTSQLKGAKLAAAWDDAFATRMQWFDWEPVRGVHLEWRDVSPTQRLPARLVVDDLDAAAALVGEDWPERLRRSRERLLALATQFPSLAEPGAILRVADAWSDVDFDLACRAATWFAAHPAHDLTARQVPVEGMGTKWLAAHESVVRRLAGIGSLGLVPGRPPRVHLTYLDPAHLDGGGRRHDVATVGDLDAVAYRPRIVLISENRDTAQLFGAVDGGIAIEGEGRGAGAVAALPWISGAQQLWYWGDMDADGLEILHGFRAAGLPVRSLFMDRAAYERWERFGVDHDHAGRPIGPRAPRDVSRLEPEERELYLALCSPEWTRHRRIEQERIPMEEAAAVVRRVG